MGHRALLIIVRTFVTQTALPTKMFNVAMAHITTGAMFTLIYGAFKAKAQSVVSAALNVYVDTVLAQTAFLTPFSHCKIASFTIGTVGAFLFCALVTHFAAFLVGASVTDLIAAAFGTFSAFKTKVNTYVAFVTLVTIWRAVNNVFTVGTFMCCMGCKG